MRIKRPFGPKGNIILGSGAEFGRNQLGFLVKTMQEYGGIAYFRLAHMPTYLISDSDLVREVLVTKSKLFEKSPFDKKILGKFLGNGLVTSDGDFHRKQRRLAQPAFHATRIQNYAEVMVEYTEALLQEWDDYSERNIADDMMLLTMQIVSKTLFNADKVTNSGDTAVSIGNAIHDLQESSNGDFVMGFPLPDWLPTANNRQRNRATLIFNAAMEQIVAKKRETAVHGKVTDEGDLLSMLMLSEDEDGATMDDKQLRDEVATLFAAGHETTSNALTWTWYLLAQHPEVESKLHEEVDRVLNGRLPTLDDLKDLPYTLQLIKESMRLYTPVWLLNGRVPLEDVEIGDYIIPKGSTVFISPYANHRQAKYFPEPDAFKPERFTPEFEKSLPKFAYMPFGGGPRVCIGNAFAMMEAQLIVATIAQRYRLELVPNQQVVPLPQITLNPQNGIQMRAVERKTAVSALAVGETAVVA
jgi:cytochrome P450